ncbi:MAG TPA: autotransporter-associated beta strand repeat-containing protein, partial [Opitutales bacterium]|nr:autotransporter-associated beta strand repeat-containing protein [Opitutales bacterium]
MSRHRFEFGRSYRVALVLSFGLTGALSVSAQTLWVGSTSTDWNTGTNWSTTNVPTLSDNVVLNTSGGNQAVISLANAFSDNLTIGLDGSSDATTLLTVMGGFTLTTSGNASLGDGSGSTGAVLVSDTSTVWNIADNFLVGNAGNGTLTIANAALVSLANGQVLTLGVQAGSNGTVNLNGGTLSLGGSNGLAAGLGNYNFNFGGGTLRVTGSDLTTSINATLGTGTNSTLNTNGFNATWSGNLSGAGGLIKTNNGFLALNGTNTFGGGLALNGGTLDINSASAIGTGTLTIAGGNLDNTSGAGVTLTTNNAQNWNLNFNFIGTNDLNLGTGAVTMNATRTITVTNGNLTVGGVISDGGNAYGLTKIGAGTLILTGNETYSGTTNINNGTLEVADGGSLFNSARLNVANQFGVNATFTVSNTTLDIPNSAIQIGSASNGTINIINGANLTTSGTQIGTGESGFSTGLVSGANSSWTVLGQFNVGWESAGCLTVGPGATMTVTGPFVVGEGTLGPGTLIINGGTVFAQEGFTIGDFNPSSAESTVQLNAGTLAIATSGFGLDNEGSAASVSFTLGGGTLQAYNGSSALVFPSSVPLTLAASTVSTLDTNGLGISIAGNISGSGGLTKIGAGTLTLSGTNVYSGITTINVGSVRFTGDTSGLGGDIVNNASLVFLQSADSSFSQNISGTGMLFQSGSGNLVFSGNATYTGDTHINGGTLIFGGNIASLSGNIIVNASVAFDLPVDGSFANTISGFGNVTQSGSGNLTLAGNNTYANLTTINSGTLIFTGSTSSLGGNMVDNSTVIFNQSSNSAFHGVISGTGTVTQNGTGTLTLNGANSYAGGTYLNSGTLALGSSTALGTGTFTIAGGSFDNVSGANLTLSTNNAQNWNGDFAFIGSHSLNLGTGAVALGGSRIITITGNTLTVGGAISDGGNGYGLTLVGSGTLELDGNNNYSGNITDNATLQIGQSADSTFSQVINGTGNLIQSGSGNLTLSGNNTLGGNIVINSGTLIFTGSTSGLGGNIVDNGTLIFNQSVDSSFAQVINGTGALTQGGSGNLTLSGNVNYAGNTTINSGTLIFTSNTTTLSGNIIDNS